MLEIVQAERKHWPDVERFLSAMEDQDDYVKDEWQDWLAHPERGMTLVALWDQQPVATTYIAFVDQEVCWFQGIRVASGYQGKGVGQALSEAGVRYTKQLGYKIARCGIDGDNRISQHVTAKSGFQMKYNYQAYTKKEFPKNLQKKGEWMPASRSDLPLYVEFQKEAELTKLMGGFLFAFNVFSPRVSVSLQEISDPWGEPHFMKYVLNGETLAFADLLLDRHDELQGEGYLVQGFALAKDADLEQIWSDLEASFYKEGYQGILAWAQENEVLPTMLLTKGYHCLSNHGFQIWEQVL